MKERDAFSSLHPAVTFLYFGLIFLFSMCLTHPVCLGISLTGAVVYRIRLGEGRRIRFLIPLSLLAAGINVAFQHRGVTILIYLPDGNPLTMESVFYGISAAAMLAAVLAWFSCYSSVMTSDKFVYLFGRVIPALSLVLSMTLRFIPRFQSHFAATRDARQCLLGKESGWFHQLRGAVADTSATVNWAMENAIETSDSMRGRGYGLPGRTSFSIYRFDDRDRGMLIWIAACGFVVVCLWIAGGLTWWYYPRMGGAGFTPVTASVLALYAALSLTPLFIDCREARFFH